MIIVIIACEGFRELGLQTGSLKDSQITASSSRADEFLPYNARVGNRLEGWIPLKTSGDELLTVHFIQVDLKEKILVKMVRAYIVISHLPFCDRSL